MIETTINRQRVRKFYSKEFVKNSIIGKNSCAETDNQVIRNNLQRTTRKTYYAVC